MYMYTLSSIVNVNGVASHRAQFNRACGIYRHRSAGAAFGVRLRSVSGGVCLSARRDNRTTELDVAVVTIVLHAQSPFRRICPEATGCDAWRRT